jgi:hypothetical protein
VILSLYPSVFTEIGTILEEEGVSTIDDLELGLTEGKRMKRGRGERGGWQTLSRASCFSAELWSRLCQYKWVFVAWIKVYSLSR